MTRLWGKTLRDIEAERQRNMTPEELGRHYGDRLMPTKTRYHFGTDIPDAEVSWREVEAERARLGLDDEGHGGGWVFAGIVLAIVGVLVALAAWLLL